MKNTLAIVNHKDQIEIELFPGIRFTPTDEELITQYLLKKVLDTSFSCEIISEVDMKNIEPWDLPSKSKLGETEWYFFCVKEKKYLTGLRTNRATARGYWKSTGKDKPISKGEIVVGGKKTLVFYEGKAPSGVKSNWITHEYRLDEKFSYDNLQRANKDDWVIRKVFLKSLGGNKVHKSELMGMDGEKVEFAPSCLQPIMGQSSFRAIESALNTVNYTSNSVDVPLHSDQNLATSSRNFIFQAHNPFNNFDNQFQFHSEAANRFSISNPIEGPLVFKNLIESNGQNINHTTTAKTEMEIFAAEIAAESMNNTEKPLVKSYLEMEKTISKEDELGIEDLDLIGEFNDYIELNYSSFNSK